MGSGSDGDGVAIVGAAWDQPGDVMSSCAQTLSQTESRSLRGKPKPTDENLAKDNDSSLDNLGRWCSVWRLPTRGA